jgi:SAM-dependent methyltransferase
MRADATRIDRFYRALRGRAASAMALRRLTALWPEAKGLDMLGYGFAGPYLEPFREQARRAVCFMPAEQGAVAWPEDGGSLTALGEEARTPFPDALFDRIVLAHALEEAGSVQRLLREMWRVLAPEGRMVIIAAHRAGAWAWTDATPFGHGRPFSKGQLSTLLGDALFEPVAWARALYAPPWNWACGEKTAKGFEAVGERVWPGFGGLILVEAVKHVGAIRPGGAAATARNRLEGAAAPALSNRESSSARGANHRQPE